MDRIKNIINNLSNSENKKFKTYYLDRISERLSLNECKRCDYLKEDFNKALDIIESSDRNNKKDLYDRIMKSIVRHLREQHHLYLDTHYRDKFISLGILSAIMAGIWFLDNIIFMISIMIIIILLFGSIGYIKDKNNRNKI